MISSGQVGNPEESLYNDNDIIYILKFHPSRSVCESVTVLSSPFLQLSLSTLANHKPFIHFYNCLFVQNLNSFNKEIPRDLPDILLNMYKISTKKNFPNIGKCKPH